VDQDGDGVDRDGEEEDCGIQDMYIIRLYIIPLYIILLYIVLQDRAKTGVANGEIAEIWGDVDGFRKIRNFSDHQINVFNIESVLKVAKKRKCAQKNLE
jgi:hypothetical protein